MAVRGVWDVRVSSLMQLGSLLRFKCELGRPFLSVALTVLRLTIKTASPPKKVYSLRPSTLIVCPRLSLFFPMAENANVVVRTYFISTFGAMHRFVDSMD